MPEQNKISVEIKSSSLTKITTVLDNNKFISSNVQFSQKTSENFSTLLPTQSNVSNGSVKVEGINDNMFGRTPFLVDLSNESGQFIKFDKYLNGSYRWHSVVVGKYTTTVLNTFAGEIINQHNNLVQDGLYKIRQDGIRLWNLEKYQIRCNDKLKSIAWNTLIDFVPIETSLGLKIPPETFENEIVLVFKVNDIVKVEKILFDTSKASINGLHYQCVLVSTKDAKGNIRQGFLYSKYEGKSNISFAGPEIVVQAKKQVIVQTESEDLGIGVVVKGLKILYMENYFTYVIHGTWARPSYKYWYRHYDGYLDIRGGFVQRVNEEHPMVWGGETGNLFTWSGKNKHHDRVMEGKALAERIKDKKTESNLSFNGIDIIAHSHGGNVVIEALKILSNSKVKIRNVVLIGVPHFKRAYTLNDKEFKEWLYYHPNILSAITGRIYNIFSTEDSVQTLWAEIDSGLGVNNFPVESTKPRIISYRELPENQKVINCPQLTNVGIGTDRKAHSVLHNNAMGNAIGRLLRTGVWTPIQEIINPYEQGYYWE